MSYKEQLEKCLALLRLYEQAHGIWWQRLFDMYTPEHRKARVLTRDGICHAFYHMYGPDVNIHRLDVMVAMLPKPVKHYSWTPGKRKPRIKHLKQTIKRLDRIINSK